MIGVFKRLLVGQPLATDQQQHQRLRKIIALAVFSSDAISSNAYATEAIMLVLLTAGIGALNLSIPICLAIIMLLLIVGFSYRQTIHAYPSGGGAYIVAHENLGQIPGLVAAGSLLIDYVLTVAVSVSAGVFAVTSLASTWGVASLASYRVEIALAFIVFITLINLRGLKESGAIFAVPTYLFVVSMFACIIIGVARLVLTGSLPQLPPPAEVHTQAQTVTLFLILQAFSAGCTALTGVEAISNGVPAFRKPESVNASRTLLAMVGILGAIFLGLTVLAQATNAMPSESESVVSQVVRTIVGTGPFYFVVQVATALILVLAANTSYADFPRLASILSHDRFLPHQFSIRGDRLVYSNGIIVLGLLASVLVIIFDAKEQAMLPLYAIGVFISFTLSQAGMVRHWLRERGPGWRRSVAINGLGAALTALVFCIIIATRFAHGAWAVLVAIPIIVLMFQSIHTHYRTIARQLSLEGAARPMAVRRHTALVLVSGVHRGTLTALEYASSIAPDNTTALYVEFDPEDTEKIRAKWQEWAGDIPLVVLPSPYRSLVRPMLRFVNELDERYKDDVLTVVVPEFVPSHWWEHLLHNQSGLLIKAALFFHRGIVVTSVPYHLDG
ncbi:APC family permease [Chloroflexia bacterium SDU3-3]|nr:APC family permease [Chloroflexia bacterium SDU3-3]